MGGKFIPGIYYINYTVMKYIIGSGFSTELYMNGYGFQKFENLNGTSVPKSIGRDPPLALAQHLGGRDPLSFWPRQTEVV